MPSPPPRRRPRRRFSQNFLRDPAITGRIVAAIDPRAGQHLVEIGPGRGALTGPLLASGCRLDAIELDRDLAQELRTGFAGVPTFTLHSGDALGFDYRSLCATADAARELRIVGNLPYNISTPLIFRLLEEVAVVRDMHFMLQREVVERLASSPGGRQWGRLGVMAQYHCRVEHLFDVPPGAFQPRPKVDSAIVRLTPREVSPWPGCDEERLRRLVQAAFAQRRKTLRNNLKGLIDSEALASLGVDPGARAETLDITQFITIANAIHEQNAI